MEIELMGTIKHLVLDGERLDHKSFHIPYKSCIVGKATVEVECYREDKHGLVESKIFEVEKYIDNILHIKTIKA